MHETKNWKLKTLFLLLVLLLPTLAQAVPNVMSYQGKLNDKNGVPVSGSVTMKFTIYDAATVGNAFWTETWTSASNEFNELQVA